MTVTEAPPGWAPEATFELESPFSARSTWEAPQSETISELWTQEEVARPAPGGRLVAFVEGAKQGHFKGDAGVAANGIRGVRLSFAVFTPTDQATGQTSGKRRYEPVTFRHGLGPASPQFFTALVANEDLRRVRFEVSAPSPTGVWQAHYAVQLNNARVVSLRVVPFDGPSTSGADGVALLQEVGFVFTSVELTSLPGGITATDGWNQRR